MQDDLLDILVHMYAQVKIILQLGVAAENPYLTTQIITFVLQAICNTRNFEEGCRNWHTRPTVDKTWQNFKDYFEDERTSLHQVQRITMRSIALHQVSFLASQVLDEAKEVKTSVRKTLLLLAEDHENDDAPEKNRAIFAR